MNKELSQRVFKSFKEWEAWLADNHDTSQGVWLKIAKKVSGIPTVTYNEALEIALCYGWIDGQKNALDEQYFLQKFTPRRPRSMWSKRNCEFVTKLIAEGKMQPAGMKEIMAAKADGRWDSAYDSPKNMVVPQDFLTELAKDKKAEAFFKTLNKTNTYAIAWRLQTAKRPETRQKRMQAFLSMLARGEKLH